MKRKWVPVWTIPALIALSVLTIGVRLSIVRTTYAISTTDRQIALLRREKEQANLKALQLRSPRRLELLAKTRYQMNVPDSKQRVHLR